MSDTARPSPPQPASADDKRVEWFGKSQRLIGGQPDSHYGWIETADGPCIVKALNPGLTAYAGTLLQHERSMLRRLQKIGAPVATLVDLGREDWLVTRFAGLSVQRLSHAGGVQGVASPLCLPWGERLGAWVHLLKRLQPMADQGVLAIDLYDANVLLPLTDRTRGQLRLHEAVMIDHAHTVEAGMGMRRPVWMDRAMRRIAPELRAAMQHDQDALIQAFHEAGADLPGYSRMPTAKDDFNRRVWAEYDAPQQLQQLLDSGNLSRDHAMQFAAGTALNQMLRLARHDKERQALAGVLQRMTHADAARRFGTLTEAADELSDVIETVPMVSRHAFKTLVPADLATPAIALDSDREPQIEQTWVAASPVHTFMAGPLQALPRKWLCLAAAVGAAIGAVVPLPW